ncbi:MULTISPECIES: tRNA (adenosine(37)-N6)-dimethylallyltransferase MiaA [Aerococcus]|uniref:tRNA (adenosine(37)-N6)-dimethylallyltransferase MiaA n=1 Tax=Aerococcus TaxID=1375 RepID=UPI0018A7A906|nr:MULTISPECIES: tRNA (adenosine(37)-N6)-dimethylallyltransferase MiaA [Aerococcus]MCY3036086.1 tRNA (adenosine(37)-N6)-dimethylallyltransferase MiaA [Aerococcus sp. Group 2]MCY3040042.1 tRNA (adenosine(37)-N6)-dimethylallyltransferase MiaA [Aerococcus sp. Group 2]MCY3040756.1 tRNA (adenosine(37)-N6)-dimethylallyltransferase MiaA [Aerococcus sp. Group 2]MCY3042748.1 tRNA (adenosine(37)-N6)-dimethylallyltransferase MiaA [Aerococcus sp. Group 2]MDK6520893.1 tRNA (adenosine(37)-N6)-dimethylallylt
MKTKLICIGGPTAVGKTALSIELAKHFQGQVINGDAMQVYQGLDIGTAKATLDERQGIPHHLLDIRSVDQPYTVADFKRDAESAVQAIEADQDLPILVGGTGLYLESFLFDLSLGGQVEPRPDYRQEMEDFASSHGNQALHQKLVELDPQAAEKIHPNNVKRVIRALEVGTFSDQLFSQAKETHDDHHSPYDYYFIGLHCDRQRLYERINHRVDLMVDQGLLKEAQWLLDQDLDPKSQSLQSIGYKEVFPYLRGEEDLETSLNLLKRNSRRYAKRQLTWLKNRMDQVHWYNLVEKEDSLATVISDVAAFLEE